jgi:hypothetical protein
LKFLAEVSEVFLRRGHSLSELPIVDVYSARERARRADRDDAIPLIRAAVDHLFRDERLLAWGVPATGVLVEILLDRGAAADAAEAQAAIERLAAARADESLVIREKPTDSGTLITERTVFTGPLASIAARMLGGRVRKTFEATTAHFGRLAERRASR